MSDLTPEAEALLMEMRDRYSWWPSHEGQRVIGILAAIEAAAAARATEPLVADAEVGRMLRAIVETYPWLVTVRLEPRVAESSISARWGDHAVETLSGKDLTSVLRGFLSLLHKDAALAAPVPAPGEGE